MSKCIFIVDDDALVRLIVEKMMTKVDDTLTFFQCDNGKAGLKKLSEYQGDFSDCIILLDLNMPVLDGWGVLDELQSTQHKDYPNITVYILSSSTDKVDIERARQYSCVRKFYHKPLTTVDITEILGFNIDGIH
jgi:CheY-like chemotaxis protein